MVAALIDQHTQEWNHSLIDASFTPEEAKLIKAILLSSLPQNDFLFWPLDRFGEYTVKSGYKLLNEECSREEAGPTSSRISNSVVSDGDRGGLMLGRMGCLGQGVVICVGVGFGLMGGGGLISIGVILVGNNMVSGCYGVGLVVQRLGQ
nr:hypothetical protein CFP56_09788 [Quercus suber]